MKPQRFTCMLVCASALFFLNSCGGGGQNASSTDTTATTDTSSMKSAPTSTIITTPQNMVIVKHKVANYGKWKSAYDGHDSARLADGLHNFVIGRGMQDSNMVTVALKADDITKAKAFAKDPGLKAAMQKGGVTGTPSISFVTMVFQDTATINSDMNIRSAATFKVKDWNTWQQAFEAADAKQERSDNGITVRAYGHDVDDDHNVMVVTAVLDSAKAYAYWKSDMLKKRRATSGVVGEPQRFIFTIVQRY